jgi:hypothetical protein
VRLTRHAIVRYQERVKPALDLEQAETELRWLLPLMERKRVPPAWIDPERLEREPDVWLVLGGDIALPMYSAQITTCLTRAAPSEHARERQTEGRRARKAQRSQPGKREKHGQVVRDARRRRREEMLNG